MNAEGAEIKSTSQQFCLWCGGGRLFLGFDDRRGAELKRALEQCFELNYAEIKRMRPA
jgi:hypothetical protein